MHQSRTLGQRLGLTEQIIKVHVAELVLLENPVGLVLVFADLRILRKKQSSEQQHEETSISPSIPRSCRDLFALLRCHQHRPTATSGFPAAMTAPFKRGIGWTAISPPCRDHHCCRHRLLPIDAGSVMNCKRTVVATLRGWRGLRGRGR